MNNIPNNPQAPQRREAMIQKEFGDFLSNNFSHRSQNKKKESLKKSASWAKFGDSIYCTRQENHSRKQSKQLKQKKISKNKIPGNNDSEKKVRKNKSKKSANKNSGHIKKFRKKPDSSFGTKSTLKPDYTTNKDKFGSKNSSKMHSNS